MDSRDTAHQARLVFTTGIGRVRYCTRCGQAEDACRCASERVTGQPGVPRDGFIRLARDRKGRGGKTVTLVMGVPGDEAALTGLAQELKRLCGSGGTVRDGVIELQGEHRDRLEPKLVALGYKVKRVGG